jgi:hypothetical protein
MRVRPVLLRLSWTVPLALLEACGGQIGPYGDAGTTDEGSIPPGNKEDGSTTGVCGEHMLSAVGGVNGQCSEEEDYACGATKYSVQCGCPAAACVCGKNGYPQSEISYPVCPGCSATSSLPSVLCGFPQ